jgi:hypothetical protein
VEPRLNLQKVQESLSKGEKLSDLGIQDINPEHLFSDLSEDNVELAETVIQSLIPENRIRYLRIILRSKEISNRNKFHRFLRPALEDKQLNLSIQQKAGLLFYITEDIGETGESSISTFNSEYKQTRADRQENMERDYNNAFEFCKKHFAESEISSTVKLPQSPKQGKTGIASETEEDQEQETKESEDEETAALGFPGFEPLGAKLGGANVGGALTGRYKGEIISKSTGETEARVCLIKQDWANGKLRIEKILSEAIAGFLLYRIYHDVMKAPYDQFAEVRLIRDDGKTGTPDQTGKHTYLMSIYIKNYVDDLWKYAFREYYKNKFRQQLSNDSPVFGKKDIERLREFYESEMRACHRKGNKEKAAAYALKLKDIFKDSDSFNQYINRNKTNAKLMSELIDDMSEAKVNDMKRPSGALFDIGHIRLTKVGQKTRKVISQLILNNEQLRKDFAAMAAPRILLGDFGLHNGNFGVAMLDGMPRLVSLDYGAAFLNPIADVNPFDKSKTGITNVIDKFYKDHFLEYDKGIIASEYMAMAFINLGDMPNEQLKGYVEEVMRVELKNQVGVSPLKEFCERLKMDKSIYENIDEYAQLRAEVERFLVERLNERKISLKKIGFGLLLENTYDEKNDRVDIAKLKTALENPELREYIVSGTFKRTDLVYHTSESIRERILSAAENMLGVQVTASKQSPLRKITTRFGLNASSQKTPSVTTPAQLSTSAPSKPDVLLEHNAASDSRPHIESGKLKKPMLPFVSKVGSTKIHESAFIQISHAVDLAHQKAETAKHVEAIRRSTLPETGTEKSRHERKMIDQRIAVLDHELDLARKHIQALQHEMNAEDAMEKEEAKKTRQAIEFQLLLVEQDRIKNRHPEQELSQTDIEAHQERKEGNIVLSAMLAERVQLQNLAMELRELIESKKSGLEAAQKLQLREDILKRDIEHAKIEVNNEKAALVKNRQGKNLPIQDAVRILSDRKSVDQIIILLEQQIELEHRLITILQHITPSSDSKIREEGIKKIHEIQDKIALTQKSIESHEKQTGTDNPELIAAKKLIDAIGVQLYLTKRISRMLHDKFKREEEERLALAFQEATRIMSLQQSAKLKIQELTERLQSTKSSLDDIDRKLQELEPKEIERRHHTPHIDVARRRREAADDLIKVLKSEIELQEMIIHAQLNELEATNEVEAIKAREELTEILSHENRIRTLVLECEESLRQFSLTPDSDEEDIIEARSAEIILKPLRTKLSLLRSTIVIYNSLIDAKREQLSINDITASGEVPPVSRKEKRFKLKDYKSIFSKPLAEAKSSVEIGKSTDLSIKMIDSSVKNYKILTDAAIFHIGQLKKLRKAHTDNQDFNLFINRLATIRSELERAKSFEEIQSIKDSITDLVDQFAENIIEINSIVSFVRKSFSEFEAASKIQQQILSELRQRALSTPDLEQSQLQQFRDKIGKASASELIKYYDENIDKLRSIKNKNIGALIYYCRQTSNLLSPTEINEITYINIGAATGSEIAKNPDSLHARSLMQAMGELGKFEQSIETVNTQTKARITKSKQTLLEAQNALKTRLEPISADLISIDILLQQKAVKDSKSINDIKEKFEMMLKIKASLANAIAQQDALIKDIDEHIERLMQVSEYDLDYDLQKNRVDFSKYTKISILNDLRKRREELISKRTSETPALKDLELLINSIIEETRPLIADKIRDAYPDISQTADTIRTTTDRKLEALNQAISKLKLPDIHENAEAFAKHIEACQSIESELRILSMSVQELKNKPVEIMRLEEHEKWMKQHQIPSPFSESLGLISETDKHIAAAFTKIGGINVDMIRLLEDNISQLVSADQKKNAEQIKKLLALRNELIVGFSRDLTAWSTKIFVSLTSDDLAARTTKSDSASLANAFLAYEKLVYFIQADILQSRSLETRTLAMERWIAIMRHCYENHDYHTLYSIESALGAVPIFRLYATKDGISQASREFLGQLGTIKKAIKSGTFTTDSFIPHLSSFQSRTLLNQNEIGERKFTLMYIKAINKLIDSLGDNLTDITHCTEADKLEVLKATTNQILEKLLTEAKNLLKALQNKPGENDIKKLIHLIETMGSIVQPYKIGMDASKINTYELKSHASQALPKIRDTMEHDIKLYEERIADILKPIKLAQQKMQSKPQYQNSLQQIITELDHTKTLALDNLSRTAEPRDKFIHPSPIVQTITDIPSSYAPEGLDGNYIDTLISKELKAALGSRQISRVMADEFNEYARKLPSLKQSKKLLNSLLKKHGISFNSATINLIHDENIRIYFLDNILNPILAKILASQLQFTRIKISDLALIDQFNQAIFNKMDNDELKSLARKMRLELSDNQIELIQAENMRLRNELQTRSIASQQEQVAALKYHKQHDILRSATSADELNKFDKYTFSTAIDQPIFYASMTIEDIRRVLEDINRRMSNKEPCHIELQKLFSNENTGDLIRESGRLFEFFSELYARSADIMAYSFIAIDKQLTENIDPYEFYRDLNKEPAPTLQKIIDRFNNTRDFIVADIVSRSSIEERTLAMAHWIRIAWKCLNNPHLTDLNMASCINAALSAASVERLKSTWAGLPKEILQLRDQIAETCQMQGNYANMRKYLVAHPNTIPYIHPFVADYTFAREKNPHIELQQFQIAYRDNLKIRSNIEEIRQTPFNIQPSPVFMSAVSDVKLKENEAYNASLSIEKRGESIEPGKLLSHTNPYAYARTFMLPPPSDKQPGKLPSVPRRHLLILSAANDSILPYLKPIQDCEFGMITDKVVSVPANIKYKIERPQVKEALEKHLTEMKLYYSQNKTRLYALVTYGVGDIAVDQISNPAAQDKILKVIKEEDFVDKYFNLIKPSLEQAFLSQAIMNQYNETNPGNTFIEDDVILLDQYAQDLFNNPRHHLLHIRDLFDEPPLRKAIATIYMAISDPDFFTVPPDADIKEKLNIENRCDLAKMFFAQLQPAETDIILQWLETPDPNPGISSEPRKLIDLLPDPIRVAVKSARRLDNIIDEFYATEKTFVNNMLALTNNICDKNGRIKADEASFLKMKDRKLTREERLLLEYFMEPYLVLAANPFGDRLAGNMESMKHISHVINTNMDYRQAILRCSIDQADMLDFISSIGGLDNIGPLEAPALLINPTQRMPRIMLLANEMTSRVAIDNHVPAGILSAAKSILDEAQSLVPKRDMAKLGQSTSASIYKKIAPQIRERQNIDISQFASNLCKLIDSICKDTIVAGEIKNAVESIETYGLNKGQSDTELMKAKKVAEILRDLGKQKSTVDMLEYLALKLKSDEEISIHQKARHENKETSLTILTTALMQALTKDRTAKITFVPDTSSGNVTVLTKNQILAVTGRKLSEPPRSTSHELTDSHLHFFESEIHPAVDKISEKVPNMTQDKHSTPIYKAVTETVDGMNACINTLKDLNRSLNEIMVTLNIKKETLDESEGEHHHLKD